MKFDKSKVVDGLCNNLEQWIGWRGYFSDCVVDMKHIVEGDVKPAELKKIESNMFWLGCNRWYLFYPVEPPKKQEPKLVPFENVQELIDWFCEREGLELSENQRPFIWIKSKDTGNEHLIDGFVREPSLSELGKTVFVCGHSYVLETLLEDFTLLDGTPIGKEEQE